MMAIMSEQKSGEQLDRLMGEQLWVSTMEMVSTRSLPYRGSKTQLPSCHS